MDDISSRGFEFNCFLEGEFMSALVIGDKVSFAYLKNIEKDNSTCYGHPTLVNYNTNAETYKGEVTSVRDIKEQPLSSTTIAYNKNIKGDRSRYIVTMELDNGDVKAFYDGRIVNPVKQVKKPEPLLKRLAKKIRKSA